MSEKDVLSQNSFPFLIQHSEIIIIFASVIRAESS